MPSTEKGRPIFDRFRPILTKQPAERPKDTLDAQAEEIRKAWIERTPARPK